MEEEVYVITIFAIGKIEAAAHKEVCTNTELRKMQSDIYEYNAMCE